MTTITVYSKPSCVQCNATYRALESIGIKPFVIDVTEHPDKLEHIKELGYLQAPVVVPSFDKDVRNPDGTRVVHWSGFRPDYIEQLKTN